MKSEVGITYRFSEIETRLIESYLILTANIGIENVTLQKVADHARVAFGTVRYHFAGKPWDLTQAATIFVLQQGYRFTEDYFLAARQRPINGVEAYIKCMFQWLEKESHYASFLVFFYYLGATKKKLLISNQEFVETARSRIVSLLHEAIGQGHYSPVKDAKKLASTIHYLVMGACVVLLSLKGHKKLTSQYVNEITEATNALIRADAITRHQKTT